MLALVLVAIWLMRGRGMRETTTDPVGESPRAVAVADREEIVSLAIDFGDERRGEFEPIAWRKGMTVRDSLAAATAASGRVKFAQQGSGDSAFLTRIEGVENEGAGGRNWTYSVNGEPGDRSFAIYRLQPGDRVLWTFAAEQ